jgi:hypothetical protein
MHPLTETVLFWGIAHYGARAGTASGKGCTDLDFITRQLQSALGLPANGKIGAREVQALLEGVKAASADRKVADYVSMMSSMSQRAQSKGISAEEMLNNRLAFHAPRKGAADAQRAAYAAVTPPPKDTREFWPSLGRTTCKPGYIGYASEDARRFASERKIAAIRDWAQGHYGSIAVSGECTDWEFIARAWQASNSHQVTGYFTQQDFAVFDRSRASDSVARPATTGTQSTTAGGTVTLFGIVLGQRLNVPWCQGQPTAPCASRLGRPQMIGGYAEKPYFDGPVRIVFPEGDTPAILVEYTEEVFRAGKSLPPGGVPTIGSIEAELVGGAVAALRFPATPSAQTLGDFRRKFGKERIESVPMENDRGAKWVGRKYIWSPGGMSITMDCTGFLGNRCQVTASSGAAESRATVKRQKGRDL